jgi:tetratricopeptide (TPR) repeat protein
LIVMKRAAMFALILGAAANAQDVDYGRLHRKCGTAIPWIGDPSIVDGIHAPLPRADRAKILADALAVAKEQKKPVFWYAPRFAGSHMYRAALLDSYMMQTLFTDPEVADVIRTRCVPLRLACDFAVNRTTKLQALETLEPMIALLDGEGRPLWKIDRIRTFDPAWFDHQLREALRRHARPPETDDPRELVRAGELDRARELLEKKDDAASKLLLAAVFRRLRKPDRARERLEAAKKDAACAGPAAVEEATLLMREGRLDEALAAFEKCDAPEAAFYRACLLHQKGREADALKTWQDLARAHPDSPWAWRAASNLTPHEDTTPHGAAVHAFETLTWGPDATWAPLATTVWPRTDKDVNDVVLRAVNFLLMHQRGDGSWSDARYAFWDGPEILPNVRMAVTALAAAALHEWKAADPDRIDRALEQARAFILDDRRMNLGKNEEIYADSYRILYLIRVKPAGAADHLKRIAQRLASRQDENGTWAHEYPNAFATAVVMQALQWAKSAGVDVPARPLKRGAAALRDARTDEKTYVYDQNHSRAMERDSSARSALCESALLIAGEGDPRALEKAVELYWKFFPQQERVRKCDFHSDGELGGFFFFHGMLHTLVAIERLDEKLQKEHRGRFLREIVKLPEIDGSFIDTHEVGKSYGTAVALLVLKESTK